MTIAVDIYLVLDNSCFSTKAGDVGKRGNASNTLHSRHEKNVHLVWRK